MKTMNSWIRNLRFKLFAALCIVLLGQGLFIRAALAKNSTDDRATDRDRTFSVISRGSGKLDLFVVNGDGCDILMKSWTGSNWTNWSSLGSAPNGDCFGTVYAVAAGNNRWDIFSTIGGYYTGDYTTVWHKSFDGKIQYGWESLGSGGNGIHSGIQAVSTGNGRIDLFTRATCLPAGCGPVLWKYRTAAGVWSPCATCAWGVLDTTGSNSGADFSLTALAHSGNRIDLFKVPFYETAISRKYFNGTSWGPVNPFTQLSLNVWKLMNGEALQTPYAVSWGTNRIDVFVRGTDNNVHINSSDDAGANWYGWASLGRGGAPIDLNSAVSAVAWGPNRLDLFTTEYFTVYYKAWTGTNWWPSQTGGWENLGNMIVEGNYPPLPVSWGPSRIDLFKYEKINSTSPLKCLYHKWTNGNGWGPSNTGWECLGPN